MENVVPIHKRDARQNVKNYRSVSLLPIFQKIFERLIHNENELVSPNQSGLKQKDSYINQFLSTTHDIYQSLNQCYKVHNSKAFSKVRHKGLKID